VGFAVKSTLGFLVLLLLFPFSRLTRRLNLRRELVYLTIPPALYFAVSIASRMNVGVRHLLPIYPFIILLAAAGAVSLAMRSRAAACTVAAMVVLHAASSLHAFPNYLAYSNELYGGPPRTYRVLSDSNVDWGQGLKQVRNYLVKNNVLDCWFAYSLPLVDLNYYGIPCKPLPSGSGYRAGFPTPVQPPSVRGVVLISATEIDGLYWGPRELNPYLPFLEKTPDDMIGDSILVFRGSFHLPLASAITHASASQQLQQEGRFNEALAEAQTAARLAPGSAEMRTRVCEVLIRMNAKTRDYSACATSE
ncbi:MAG: hypothetical protein ABI822_33015, partial [Bryobacteraceae bacterium]